MSFSSANRNSTANPILLKIKVVGNGVGPSMSDCGTRCAKAAKLGTVHSITIFALESPVSAQHPKMVIECTVPNFG